MNANNLQINFFYKFRAMTRDNNETCSQEPIFYKADEDGRLGKFGLTHHLKALRTSTPTPLKKKKTYITFLVSERESNDHRNKIKSTSSHFSLLEFHCSFIS